MRNGLHSGILHRNDDRVGRRVYPQVPGLRARTFGDRIHRVEINDIQRQVQQVQSRNHCGIRRGRGCSRSLHLGDTSLLHFRVAHFVKTQDWAGSNFHCRSIVRYIQPVLLSLAMAVPQWFKLRELWLT